MMIEERADYSVRAFDAVVMNLADERHAQAGDCLRQPPLVAFGRQGESVLEAFRSRAQPIVVGRLSIAFADVVQ